MLLPTHGSTYNVTFTVYRKTASGTETQLTGHRSLTYHFLSGITVWDNNHYYNSNTRSRIDNLTTDHYHYAPDTPSFDSSKLTDLIEFKDSLGRERTSPVIYEFDESFEFDLYGRVYYVDTSEYSQVEIINVTHSSSVILRGQRQRHRHMSELTAFRFAVDTVSPLRWNEEADGNIHTIKPKNYWDVRSMYDDREQFHTTQVSFFVFSEWGAFLQVGSTNTEENSGRLFFKNRSE